LRFFRFGLTMGEEENAMTTLTPPRNAMDPIAPINREAISRLSRVIDSEPAVPTAPRLVGTDGEEVELPDEVYRVLTIVVNEMKAGHAVTVTPLSQRISTQQAADLLGVSRPTLVDLLETGKIAFEQPGRHRRVLLSDVLAYREEKHRSAIRTLDELTAEASAAGLYDVSAPDYAEALTKARAASSGGQA
jgi:excisionase family DNA binding protein